MAVFSGAVAFRRLLSVFALVPLTVVPALAQGFSGIHAGVLVGHESGTGSSPLFDLEMAGGIAGLEVGATYQFDNGWVVGVSADVGRSYTTGRYLDGGYLAFEGNGELSARLLGRVGYAVGSVLPFVTAGVGYMQSTSSMSCPAGAPAFSICDTLGEFSTSTGDARFGYAVGAGLEVALAENISMKAEYLYSNYGTRELTHNPPVIDPQTTDVSLSSSAIRTGLLFRF